MCGIIIYCMASQMDFMFKITFFLFAAELIQAHQQYYVAKEHKRIEFYWTKFKRLESHRMEENRSEYYRMKFKRIESQLYECQAFLFHLGLLDTKYYKVCNKDHQNVIIPLVVIKNLSQVCIPLPSPCIHNDHNIVNYM